MSLDSADAPDPLVGQVLGGAYRITRLIGRGGMGAVYEASHLRLPKRFAVKFLQKDLPKDKEAFARFQREAEIASSLGNRHIAEVVDFNFTPDGSPYMVMEFLDGEDLATRLRTAGRLAAAAAIDVCGQIASGLSAAHKKGIVHRDLKPENIFLCASDDGQDFVKLLDFGISKIRGAQKTLTADMTMLGTPAYMSPEQARGDTRNIDHRTDVYALGAVMYEALAGRPAFDGESVYAILMKIGSEMPPAIHEVAPDVSPGVDAVLRQAMAKDPAARPQSVSELAQALKTALNAPAPPVVTLEKPGTMPPRTKSHAPAAMAPTIARAATTSTLSSGAAEIIADASLQPRRGKVVAIGAALGLCGIVAIVMATKSKPLPQPAAPPPVAIAAPMPKPVPSPPPAKVHVKLVGAPPQARVLLDGRPVDGDALELPRSDEPRKLAVSANGYRPRELEFVATHDRDLNLALEKLPRVEVAPKKKTTPHKAKPSLVGGSDL